MWPFELSPSANEGKMHKIYSPKAPLPLDVRMCTLILKYVEN